MRHTIDVPCSVSCHTTGVSHSLCVTVPFFGDCSAIWLLYKLYYKYLCLQTGSEQNVHLDSVWYSQVKNILSYSHTPHVLEAVGYQYGTYIVQKPHVQKLQIYFCDMLDCINLVSIHITHFRLFLQHLSI